MLQSTVSAYEETPAIIANGMTENRTECPRDVNFYVIHFVRLKNHRSCAECVFVFRDGGKNSF